MKKHTGFADIICSRAWRDDDNETWEIEHLWFYGNGTYSTCDEDGNHEPFPQDEDDSVEAYCADAEASWLTYARDCAETGEDPLCNYNVRRTIEKTENWVIWFTDWIGREQHGYAVIDGRHGSFHSRSHTHIFEPQNFPKPLAEYLFLTNVGGRWCMEGVTMEDIRNDAGYVSATGPKYYMKLKIKYTADRNARDVKRDVKAAANKHLEIAAK